MIDFKKFNSVISLTSYFTSDEKCKHAIIESRWSDGDVVCPYCGGHHCVVRKDGKFLCKACGKNFSCLVGTIFENTKLPLIKWFLAMYFISSHKKGISSYQLAKNIEVTQMTAWYMLQKIRLVLTYKKICHQEKVWMIGAVCLALIAFYILELGFNTKAGYEYSTRLLLPLGLSLLTFGLGLVFAKWQLRRHAQQLREIERGLEELREFEK